MATSAQVREIFKAIVTLMGFAFDCPVMNMARTFPVTGFAPSRRSLSYCLTYFPRWPDNLLDSLPRNSRLPSNLLVGYASQV